MDDFSVLMSIYNKDNPRYLKEALKSVLFDQTCKPQEIILVIDGPINGDLVNVVNEFEQSFDGDFIIKKNKANLGLAKSLNIGLVYVTNDFVARMDSDDISLPDRFEKQLGMLKSDPSLTLVGGWYLQFDEDMLVVETDRKVPEFMSAIRKYAKTRVPFNHVTIMFRKEDVLHAGGYYEQDGTFEDWWLALMLINKGLQMYNIQEYLVKVRGGDDFIQRRGGWNYLKKEISNLFEMHNKKLLNSTDLFLNLLIRSAVRLVPNFMRKLVYSVIRVYNQ